MRKLFIKLIEQTTLILRILKHVTKMSLFWKHKKNNYLRMQNKTKTKLVLGFVQYVEQENMGS